MFWHELRTGAGLFASLQGDFLGHPQWILSLCQVGQQRTFLAPGQALQGVEAGVSKQLDLGHHISLPLGKQSSGHALGFSCCASRTSLVCAVPDVVLARAQVLSGKV